MRKKLADSLNRRKYKLAGISNKFSSSFGNKHLMISKDDNLNQPAYESNLLKRGESKKLKSLQISSLKNYDNKDFFNDEYSNKNLRNFKYNSNELVKGTRLFNKIMSTDRKGHILRILDSFDREHIEIGNNIPLDLHLRKYFLKFKFVKSSDREFISDQIFNLIRYKGLIDFLTKPPLNWFSRFDTYYNSNFELQKKNVNIPGYDTN